MKAVQPLATASWTASELPKCLNRELWFETRCILAGVTLYVNPNIPFLVRSGMLASREQALYNSPERSDHNLP
jgi:hypothetical protein